MGIATTNNAIRAKFEALASEAVWTVLWDAAPDQSPPAGAHIEFAILSATRTQITFGAIGTRRFRYTGVMSANVLAPGATGESVAEAMADAIAAEFQASTVGGITYRTPDIQRIGRVGRHFALNVSCPFYADEVS
jgi:hypothetical protein